MVRRILSDRAMVRVRYLGVGGLRLDTSVDCIADHSPDPHTTRSPNSDNTTTLRTLRVPAPSRTHLWHASPTPKPGYLTDT